MQSSLSRRINVQANGLISFTGEKSSRSTNFSDEPIVPIESTLYLYHLDESEVIRCCALLAYQLRLKHNVIYAFSPEEMNKTQLNQFQLFNRVSCFSEYLELCKSFIVCFRTCSDNITTKFSQASAARSQAGTKRKRASTDNDDEFQELQSVYEQMQNMRRMFDFYFNIFDGSEFDRYLIYEPLYLDSCLSSDVPLTMQLADFTDIPTLFSSLMRLTLVSTDFSNTQFAAFFGGGLLLIMLLYLTSDEVLRDVNAVTSTGDNPIPSAGQQAYAHWTRLTILNPADREAVCLLRDTHSDAYHRAIATLPANEFDPHLGHVYMSKGDTLSTLFLQFNSRLFLRLYEWPERQDVKSHLINKYVCDNIASYFLKSGRSKQHTWIKFFKRKRNTTGQAAPLPFTEENKNPQNNNSATPSSFTTWPSEHASTPENLPQIFINMPALHGLYDALARGMTKNNPKRQRAESTQNPTNALSSYSGTATVSADGAEIKHSWDALESFKQSYISFFINGFSLRPHFRQWYQKMAETFIVRSGGYRGFCPRNHPRTFCFKDDLSHLYAPDCKDCTASLYSDGHTGNNDSVFSFEKWAKDIHTLLFPYNFLLISAAFLKNKSVLCDDTLRDAWILKAQEILVSRKFSADKCLKCFNYLIKLEKRSRLIVEEGQLKQIFMSAMENLPFIRDLMDMNDEDVDNQKNNYAHLNTDNQQTTATNSPHCSDKMDLS